VGEIESKVAGFMAVGRSKHPSLTSPSGCVGHQVHFYVADIAVVQLIDSARMPILYIDLMSQPSRACYILCKSVSLYIDVCLFTCPLVSDPL
jgi:hypothetical protein